MASFIVRPSSPGSGFETAGAIVDDHPGYQFAMEMQTRPVYPSAYFKWGWKHDRAWVTSLVLHELAHMWFGDSVAVNQWKDIWLNEGPASYAEWLWAEHEGQATPQEILETTWADIPADKPFWQIVIGDPGAADMFHGAVYVRGAMTVHALRNEVGDEDFWQILEQWLDRDPQTPARVYRALHTLGEEATPNDAGKRVFDGEGRCLKCGSRVSFADVTDTAVFVGNEIVKRYAGDISNRNCVRCIYPKQYSEYEDYDGGSSIRANRHQSGAAQR